jgi:hypothetical protein
VAIDLGKWKIGLAIFHVEGGYGTLKRAATVTDHGGPECVAGTVADEAPSNAVWVVEWPQKYKDKRKYHENIDELLEVGKALAKRIQWNEKYPPRAWKANVPKPAHHSRVARELTAEELGLMPSRKEHDAWDAVGIGLFAVGRLGRGGKKI